MRFLMYFWLFLAFFANKCSNMDKLKNYGKFWISVNFARILMGLWAKLIFLPFLVNFAGKQTNIGQNYAVLRNSNPQIRLDVFSWVYAVYSFKNRYFLHFFIFLHFWILPLRKYCLKSPKVVGNRQTIS